MSDWNEDRRREKIKIYCMIGAMVVVIIAVIVLAILLFWPKKKQTTTVQEETTQTETESTEAETMKIVASTTKAETQQATTQSATTSVSLFTDTDDYVTAKEVTNLRDSYYDNGNVVASLTYGEYLERTGYNENGWSRLLYNGQVVYAKTQLLLKEGETTATIAAWRDEYNMTYVDVNEQVTAKEETNLRTVPSSDDDSTIYATIKNGTYVTRIGVGDKGWSKISYDGQILYAITSYLVAQ